jgi:hypothetical protein
LSCGKFQASHFCVLDLSQQTIHAQINQKQIPEWFFGKARQPTHASRGRLMGKLIYLLILVGAAIAAIGARELMIYGWDTTSQFEIGGGVVVIVAALALSGVTRWR